MTKGETRREQLLAILRKAGEPVPGGQLATQLGTSRQAVVQDIALLRTSGERIIATSRGYMLASTLQDPAYRAELVVRHSPEQTGEELYAMVDQGVTVIDVAVTHKIYGEMRAGLQLTSRADVAEFLDKVGTGRAHLLSELTDGVHLHLIEAPTPDLLNRAKAELQRLGYLVTEERTEHEGTVNGSRYQSNS